MSHFNHYCENQTIHKVTNTVPARYPIPQVIWHLNNYASIFEITWTPSIMGKITFFSLDG